MGSRKLNVILDSSVWIGYFDEIDSNHKKAVKLVTAVTTDTVVLTEYLLLEVASVLKRKIGQRRTANIIEVMLQLENVKVLESVYFFQQTLQQFLLWDEKYVSFVDMSLAVLSKDFEVVTLDKKLAKVLGR